MGSGLYDSTIEETLVGMALGDRAEVTVKGETVAFSVEKVEKRHFPALTDALVKELGLEGIEDMAAYRRYMGEKLRTAYARTLGEKLVQCLLEKAVAEPDPEDIQKVIDLEYEPLRVRFGLDEMTPEKWKEDLGRAELRAFYEQIYPDVAILFGTTSKESFYESRQEAARQTILECLLLSGILGQEADPTQDPKANEKLRQGLTARLIGMIYGG